MSLMATEIAETGAAICTQLVANADASEALAAELRVAAPSLPPKSDRWRPPSR